MYAYRNCREQNVCPDKPASHMLLEIYFMCNINTHLHCTAHVEIKLLVTTVWVRENFSELSWFETDGRLQGRNWDSPRL